MTDARWHPWWLRMGLLVALVGCGKGPSEPVVRVTGRITNQGQPLTVERADVGLGMIKLEFWPANGGPQAVPYETTADTNGNFKVLGREGFGILPGKYKVAVYQFDPYPQVDKLKGNFSPARTPIEREIAGDVGSEVKIEIDLAKPAG